MLERIDRPSVRFDGDGQPPHKEQRITLCERNCCSEPLRCPSCGEINLHHDCVTVFDRSEDEEKTRKTVVGVGVTVKSVRSHNSVNPSRRRDGLAIKFWCEHCHVIPELTIEQHKGSTYLHWRIVWF